MIYGIGVDIVHSERIKAAVEKWGRRFLERVFTDKEIAYCYEKRNPYLSLSVRFAAKEALIKALGSGISVSMRDIDVVRTRSGQPCIRVKGRLDSFFRDRSIHRTHLSLSHEREYGVACVVLEGKS